MKPSWKNRRRVIFATLIFCAGIVVFIAIDGRDTKVNETIVMGAFLLAAAVIGSYVFGAAWNDKNVMERLGGDAYAGEDQDGRYAPPPGWPAEMPLGEHYREPG